MEKENQLAAQEQSPTNLIALAIQQGADVEKLEKLMALQERWEAKEARKSFFTALSDFQRDCPVITKNKSAAFSSGGSKVGYKFATLDHIIAIVKEPLAKHGLSYRFEFKDEAGAISVTCVLTHLHGHSERTPMTAQADTSGAKNGIQARGSTLTYLQRYTLSGSLGISSADEDVDGKQPDKEKHTEEQIKKSIALLEDAQSLVAQMDAEELKKASKDIISTAKKEGMTGAHLAELKDFMNKTYKEKKDETGTAPK